MPSWVCPDASFLLKMLLDAALRARCLGLWREWKEGGNPIAAPGLLYYEVTNALHRYVVAGELKPQEASRALTLLLYLDVALYADKELHRRALDLAERLQLPAAYDAHYLALREYLDADFFTADGRLVRNLRGRVQKVHLVQPLDREGRGI
ncbi:MAG: type II toxin-antitoxin system VapC family toxin [Armatimonadetes bacterium]|nr:type II toxin-antitoxin system VapC family toxin [Armatimonadota bacterium]